MESDRIRVQAQKREERVREATEDEIKASVSKARREAQAAADEVAPSWLRGESKASTAGYRTF
jgi:vacuolar-type H+-ATPase subunit E/Vma4